MIRFSITPKDLLVLVDNAVPTWRGRAAKLQKAINKKRKVAEGEGIWSEIKEVFMERQGWKCMYCEKPMPKPAPPALAPAGAAQGKVEYDVEHFRPKNSVKAWPTAAVKKLRRVDYDGQLTKPPAGGYFRLALDPLNYGVSCKTCNSELKGDRFPILGTPDRRTTDRGKLDATEQPCLVLPIGDAADDPETILEWLGPTVRARGGTVRGRTIVDFFQLDTRGDLVEGRAAVICLLFPKLQASKGNSSAARKAKDFVKSLTEPTSTWAACARAFVALHKATPAEAARWDALCTEYLTRRDPSVFT